MPATSLNRKDTMLNPIFTEIANVDWEHHLPKMYAFRNGMIFGLPGYADQPFPPRTVLPVDREHSRRGLALFHAAVDRHFVGLGAERAKDASASIAHTFATRMDLIDPRADQLL